MAIDRLKICRWLGATRQDHDVVHPSWNCVEDSIRALNGADLNDLHLYPNRTESTWLAVGGGSGGDVVTGADPAGRFPILVTSKNCHIDSIELMIGGQASDYAAKHVVSLEEAMAAARAFYDAGGFECGVEWSYG